MTRRNASITFLGPVTPKAVDPATQSRGYSFQLLQVGNQPFTLSYPSEEEAETNRAIFMGLEGAVDVLSEDVFQSIIQGLTLAYKQGLAQGRSQSEFVASQVLGTQVQSRSRETPGDSETIPPHNIIGEPV